jgi:hypothetical protein
MIPIIFFISSDWKFSTTNDVLTINDLECVELSSDSEASSRVEIIDLTADEATSSGSDDRPLHPRKRARPTNKQPTARAAVHATAHRDSGRPVV